MTFLILMNKKESYYCDFSRILHQVSCQALYPAFGPPVCNVIICFYRNRAKQETNQRVSHLSYEK